LDRTGVQSFYRYQACVYDWTRWTILHGRRRAVARLGLRPDSEVLEIGCGTGLNFRYMLDYLDPARGRLVGLDFSPSMLRQAEKRVAGCGWRNVELVEADAARVDLGRRFDGILFAYSLTMIPDWPAALERAVEHLKTGGRVVVLDFGQFEGWGPLAPLMRGWLRLNHVETVGPYEQKLREAFPDLEISYWLGRYNFIAVGQVNSQPSPISRQRSAPGRPLTGAAFVRGRPQPAIPELHPSAADRQPATVDRPPPVVNPQSATERCDGPRD
jgi:S-adenosylmethionine-diacylgycerolhomoserine-N-methlytransferase